MRLLIRADAGPEIGSGHLLRCLAISQAWREMGGEAAVTGLLDPPSQARVRDEGLNLQALAGCSPGSSQDAAQTVASARAFGAELVVVDGYPLGTSYQRSLQAAGLKLLCVDDDGRSKEYCCDAILNQNSEQARSLYDRRPPGCKLLLGPGYALLRKEFLSWAGSTRPVPERATRLLVTMGGSDPGQVTETVLPAALESGLEVVVVTGASNPQSDRLAEVVDEIPRVIVKHAVQDMASLMAECDLALTGAGSTCWELAFMGVPAILVVLASNQEMVASTIAGSGAGLVAGHAPLAASSGLGDLLASLVPAQARRQAMAEAGRKLVDGGGPARVADALRDLLRPAA